MAVFASRPSFAGKAREELDMLDRSRLLELLPHPAIVYDRTSDLFLWPAGVSTTAGLHLRTLDLDQKPDPRRHGYQPHRRSAHRAVNVAGDLIQRTCDPSLSSTNRSSS